MDFTLNALLGVKEPLSKLSHEPLPLKVAFKLQKTLKAIDAELQDLEQARVNLVKALGETQKDGGLKVPEDKLADFQKQYEELLMEEVDIPVDQISLDDLDAVKMTTQDMLKLEFLFIEE